MFNVYVNGIALEAEMDFDVIKLNVRPILSLEELLLESIFSFNSGTVCVRNDISENDAAILCKLLEEQGLICFYKKNENSPPNLNN